MVFYKSKLKKESHQQCDEYTNNYAFIWNKISNMAISTVEKFTFLNLLKYRRN